MKKIDDTDIEKSPYYITDKNGKVTGEVYYDKVKGLWVLNRNGSYRTTSYVNFDDAVTEGKKFDCKEFLDLNFGMVMFTFVVIMMIGIVISFVAHGPCK